MSHTFIRQDTQIRNSDSYDDTLAAGLTLETGQTQIEGDLNALRSQAKRAIWADAVGNWYDDIQTVNSKKRAITALNTDLDDVEEKRLLFRTQVLTDIGVTALQNWEILSVAGSETPTVVRASGVTTIGAVCATSAFSGAGFNVFELVEIAGPNAISPKNLVIVRDATTGQPIQSSGRDVYGLLQAESTGVDGTAFNDTVSGNRVKISFVRQNATFDDLEAVPVADIAGKTINYSYITRINFDAVPETAFLSNDPFIDQSASVDVTLQNAVNNQLTPTTVSTNQDLVLAAGVQWCWQDLTATDFFCLIEGSGGGVTQVQVSGATDLFNVDAVDNDFLNGIKVDTGAAGTTINVGVTANQIDAGGVLRVASGGAGDLNLAGALELNLTDSYRAGSTWSLVNGIALADASAEWSTFETNFGEVSLLNAINQAFSSGGTTRGTKTYAVVTSTTAADLDVGGIGGGTNLDAQLPDMSTGTFLTDYDVYLNGALLRPGANAAANNDYYPGTSLVNGQLRFEFSVKAGANPDVICVIPWIV